MIELVEKNQRALMNDFAEEVYEADPTRWSSPSAQTSFFKYIRQHGRAINDPTSQRSPLDNNREVYNDIITALRY